ncbi:MAG: adenylate/guanylate cyclase domain-containing protein [Thermodesulfobacteriota bacterium]
MIKTLGQRLVAFLLIPVASLLFLAGFLGFLYARSVMLREWREAAVLKLERAAHHLDMRLSRPVEWIHMFHKTAEDQGGPIVQDWVLDQLRILEGVTRVDLQWLHSPPEAGKGMRFHQGMISEVTSPRMDARTGEKTLDLISELRNVTGEVVGKLQVSLSFDYLMQDLLKLGWLQSYQACLVDGSGHYLAHAMGVGDRSHLAETGDTVEAAILADMKEKPFGTVLGEGQSRKTVGGFYRLTQAPWTLVMFAQEEEILSPIIKFQLYYFLVGLTSVLLILLLIRLIGGAMVRAVRDLSMAADRITRGTYGKPLPVTTSDEMGHLIRSFNQMVEGLKEKDFISMTFGRYVDHEVAMEILKKPEIARLGGDKRLVSILMSDIRGFTPLSDSLRPEGTIRILNLYFARMIECVQKHKGVIVDFLGDGLLVFFDPLDGPVLPVLRRAVQCALDMQAAMNGLNSDIRAQGLPELQIGIGVNAGEVVVGNIGSESRAKYGIVGPAVNMTQRMQALAKGGQVVISDVIFWPLSEELRIRRSFTPRLKGIGGAAELFLVEGIGEP